MISAPVEENPMPHASAKDGTRLYYEEAGSGTPVVFIHEFAGDCRSWEPQLRFFARYFRCIAYNARGFPPSEVPGEAAKYSQAHARDDAIAVLDHLGLERAHVVGLSMGGFAALHVGISHPGRARSLVVAGCGYGAEPDKKEKFRAECEAAAASFERDWGAAAGRYALGPTRVQFQNKDPRGWAEFARQLAEHSPQGQALTMRGVQMQRPSLWELTEAMKKIDVPTLIVTGDEDDPCLEPALLMKRHIATSGLVVLPWSGHTINIEEPDAFNRALLEFFLRVDEGRAARRDPRSAASGILGFTKK
jgi:pimeloyl-ACP methyl ester carboxylesterase